MGKKPAIVHEGALVSEQGALFAYLADLHAEHLSKVDVPMLFLQGTGDELAE